MTPIPPIPEDLQELSRRIVVKVARDTAEILHTRNSLGDADDGFEGIAESDFCDEAEALATGEECGCLEPEEAIAGSLMMWVNSLIAERIAKLTADLSAMTEDRDLWQGEHNEDCPNGGSERAMTLTIWPHYETKHIKGMEDLRAIFKDGECNELNFVLFSTSGVHGTYTTIEEIEQSLTKYGPDPDFMKGDEDYDKIPDDHHVADLTTLIVQPRLCVLRYGNVKVTLEDIPYLKKLRQSAWNVVQKIGGQQ